MRSVTWSRPTDKVYKENPGRDRNRLRRELAELLRVDVVFIPKEPYDGIGHADGVVRFVEDGTGRPSNVIRGRARPEADIESRFKGHARVEENRRFVRLTWERIRDRVVQVAPPTAERNLLVAYLKGKTLGYAVRWRGGREFDDLRQAFAG